MAPKIRLSPVVLVARALALVAAACGSSSKNNSSTGANATTATGSPTTAATVSTWQGTQASGGLALGALLPQSGSLKVIYKSLCTPVQMAVDEINAAGGVNGKPVSLVFADDGTSPDVASTSLNTLVTSDK